MKLSKKIRDAHNEINRKLEEINAKDSENDNSASEPVEKAEGF